MLLPPGDEPVEWRRGFDDQRPFVSTLSAFPAAFNMAELSWRPLRVRLRELGLVGNQHAIEHHARRLREIADQLEVEGHGDPQAIRDLRAAAGGMARMIEAVSWRRQFRR